MSFLSCEEMLAAARSQKITLAEAVLRSDLDESRLTEEQSRAAMHHLWQVMQATSREYDPAQRSRSGLSGGDADPERDMLLFTNCTLLLTDGEFSDFLSEINEVALKYMKVEAKADSKTRQITLISAPVNEQET